MRKYPLRLLSSVMIVLCAVIRLGYFNVMEEERQRSTAENRKEYEGMPVTSVAMILPLIYMGRFNIPSHIFPYVFQGFMLPTNKGLLVMFTIMVVILLGYLKKIHVI